MYRAMTISRLLVASVAIWRFSTLLFAGSNNGGRSQILSPRPENLFGIRFVDSVCWLSVWLSAQNAIETAAGVAGVLLSWFLFSSLSRFFSAATHTLSDGSDPLQAIAAGRTDLPNADFRCLAVEHSMQANHG